MAVPKISVLVDLPTSVVTGGNSKCSLILQASLLEQLLCQKYKRQANGPSVRSGTKQLTVWVCIGRMAVFESRARMADSATSDENYYIERLFKNSK